MKKQQIIKIIKENTISVHDLIEANHHYFVNRIEWWVCDGKNELIPMQQGNYMKEDANNIYIGSFDILETPDNEDEDWDDEEDGDWETEWPYYYDDVHDQLQERIQDIISEFERPKLI